MSILLKTDNPKILKIAQTLYKGSNLKIYEDALKSLKYKGMSAIVLTQNKHVLAPDSDKQYEYKAEKVLSLKADWRKRIFLIHK